MQNKEFGWWRKCMKLYEIRTKLIKFWFIEDKPKKKQDRSVFYRGI